MPKKTKRREVAVQTRLSPTEHRKLAKKAHKDGVSISAWIRQLILQQINT